MRLSTPTFMTMLVSVILAVIGMLAHYGNVSLPIIGSHGTLAILIGYLVLLAGVLVRGL